jgi:hypothetical protein
VAADVVHRACGRAPFDGYGIRGVPRHSPAARPGRALDEEAIEVKATEHVSADDLRGLRALAEEGALRHYLCVSLERRRRAIDGIVILPYAEFLDGLWGGEWH